MNRIIIFSEQPKLKPKLPMISFEEIKNIKDIRTKVLLVTVKESSRKQMKKIAKMLNVQSPMSLGYYTDHMREFSDERYVFKESFISSFKRCLPVFDDFYVLAPVF